MAQRILLGVAGRGRNAPDQNVQPAGSLCRLARQLNLPTLRWVRQHALVPRIRTVSPSSPTPSPTPQLPWLRASPHGAELDILVQPRASRTKVVGIHDNRLKLQLAAPPVDGAANEALVGFVADALRVPRRQVTLLRGQTSRRKTVLVEGVAPEEIVRSLTETPR